MTRGNNTVGNLAKWPFRPISVLLKKFYPRNIGHMPAVKFSSRLDLERKYSFFKVPCYLKSENQPKSTFHLDIYVRKVLFVQLCLY
jgi:hypothetical protein